MKTHLLYSIASIFTFSVTTLVVNTSVKTLSQGFTYRKLIKSAATNGYYFYSDLKDNKTDLISKINNSNSVKLNSDSIDLTEVRPPLNLRPIEKAKEIFYAVQVGVCNSAFFPKSFNQFEYLNNEFLSNGLVRYSYGRFLTFNEAEAARKSIAEKGINDAFVVTYINSKRFTMSQINNIVQASDYKNINREKNRNVISFTSQSGRAEIKKINSKNIQKINLTYTVVLGEYKDFVPNNKASIFIELKKMGLKSIDSGSKTFYCLGTFSSKAEAEFLKEEMNEMGLENARIINYSNNILLCLK
jgi:hypothetical protein